MTRRGAIYAGKPQNTTQLTTSIRGLALEKPRVSTGKRKRKRKESSFVRGTVFVLQRPRSIRSRLAVCRCSLISANFLLSADSPLRPTPCFVPTPDSLLSPCAISTPLLPTNFLRVTEPYSPPIFYALPTPNSLLHTDPLRFADSLVHADSLHSAEPLLFTAPSFPPTPCPSPTPCFLLTFYALRTP